MCDIHLIARLLQIGPFTFALGMATFRGKLINVPYFQNCLLLINFIKFFPLTLASGQRSELVMQ